MTDVLTIMPDRVGEPSDKMDGAAAVGQFLREVSLVDLVVEMVQNDLDAGATRTSFSFGEQGILCEGDGEPLNAKAWGRLESVIGAGGDVEAKRGGIGSKNHGLRSLFLLSDRIGVQSDGLRTDLTVRGDLKNEKRFKPAFWPRVADTNAPKVGTRIFAPYREASVKVPDGDNTTLHPPESAMLDELWRAAIADASERFISASRPGADWRYTLKLSRHGLGAVTVTFECAAVGGKSRGLWLRTCRVRHDDGPPKTVLRRHAVRFRCAIDDGGKIPKLFQAGGRTWGELNWRIDNAGRPIADRGRLRYPIGFSSQDARSGHGFDISAAFIAGRSRHDVSADRRNSELIQQGRDAFSAVGDLLGKVYGTRATVLLRGLEPRAMDAAAERKIVRDMVEAGGLCAATFNKEAVPRIIGHEAMAAGSTILLPIATDDRLASLATVAGLAARAGAVLHPGTPDFVRVHLEAIAAEPRTAVRRFGEIDAAELVLISENKGEELSTETTARRTAAALQALDAVRRRSRLQGEVVARLKDKGALPTFDNRFVAWRTARRLDRSPPTIPGVQAPPVVHKAIMRANILTKGNLSIPPFNLDEYLSAIDFNPARSSVRQRFFGWLNGEAHSLKAATLRKIAEKPVWPGSDGQHRPLSSYCHPKPRKLQQVLSTSLVAPAAATVVLIGSRKLPPKSPQIRSAPSDQELLDWHTHTLATVKAEQDPGKARALIDRLEKDMAWIIERHPAVAVQMGLSHETLSQTGKMVAVTQLHVPSIATAACGLPASDLTRPRNTALYQKLGAHARPTPGAVLTALRSDPDAQKLFVRLEAYKRGTHQLSELSAERILPVDGAVQAGDDCAFVGEPDFWGEWKVGIDGNSVADHHALLSQLGVIRARPTRDLSVSFFTWLAQQSRAVQQRHHAHIDRHWKDLSAGPQGWIASNEDVACIPITSSGKPFELFSLASAMRSSESIYLDDFPEIRDAALSGGKLRLTLIKAPGARTTILDLLAAVGVRSLRAAAGSPRAVSGSGAVELVGDLALELSQLQDKKRLAELRSRLPLNGVTTSDLRPEWQKMLKAIEGVRSRPTLTSLYRLHGRDYEVPVRSGLDRDTRLILVASDADKLHEMYEVLADHLFKTGKANAWGLLRASRDRRQLEFLATGMEQAEEQEEPGEDGEDPETADLSVDKGHGLSAAKLTPVMPDPKPLAPILNPTLVPKRRNTAPKARSQSQPTQSLEEEDQKRALKQEHYGYHCQACIGEMDVLKAAPPGTYVFAPGYRQRILQAHHVQHRQNGGGLGAGNLIVLCEYHHRLLGDQLARGPVLTGLASATTLKRAFPKDEAGKVLETQSGLLVQIPISADPFSARLFFTQEHATAWLRDGS